MPDIAVDPELCIDCGACIALCTARVFNVIDGRTAAVAPEECWLCGHCVAACPADAIRHGDYPLEACPSVDPRALPALNELVATFRERRSVRVFRDKPVPRDAVRDLVEIGRWAPSAHNGQPVDWLAFDAPGRIVDLRAQAVDVLAQIAHSLRSQGLAGADRLERVAQRHARGEDPIFRGAPVVLVAHVPSADRFGRDDAVYAAYNLMLAAQHSGLGTCQIGYFQIALDHGRALRQAIGLPDGRRAELTMVLGYPLYRFHRALPRRQPHIIWNPG